MVAEATDAFGGLDILVNNAGVTRAGTIEETTEALYDEMFDLNMKGYFFCARAALPALERSGHGSIINITSIHGGAGFPNQPPTRGPKAPSSDSRDRLPSSWRRGTCE